MSIPKLRSAAVLLWSSVLRVSIRIIQTLAMSFRRFFRQIGNTRFGIRTALLLVLAFLVLHTCFLLLVRTGYRLTASKNPAGQWTRVREDRAVLQVADKKRAVVDPPEKPPVVVPVQKPEAVVIAEKPDPVNRSAVQHNVNNHAPGVARNIVQKLLQKPPNLGKVQSKADSNLKENKTKPASQKVTKDSITKKNCIRYISLYTPRMKPFEYWREYVYLKEAFFKAKHSNGSSPIQQHREFPTMFIECPGYRCDVAVRPTADERFLARSDAIMFNMAPQEVRYKMPTISDRLVQILPRRVKIFFYGMECPLMMSYWDNTIKDIKYHYTMTYHSDSDVYFPYGRYVPGHPMDTEEHNYAENKTKLVTWMASNCDHTFWPRLEWVNRLKKIMPFDIYGRCGNLTCLPPLSPNCTKSHAVYKFYLALENAPCDEYISEKFWVNSLLNGVVPIVYGGTRESYERVAPPNSFIHVSDFSSQRELVDYLKMIDKNDNLYNEFFAWRRLGHIENIYPDLYPKDFCRLLPKLSKYSKPPIKKIGDSKYFRGCRGGSHRNFTQKGDINTWAPWR